MLLYQISAASRNVNETLENLEKMFLQGSG